MRYKFIQDFVLLMKILVISCLGLQLSNEMIFFIILLATIPIATLYVSLIFHLNKPMFVYLHLSLLNQ